jgi:hypothetical protein
MYSIGVVGFSARKFDHEVARELLREALQQVLASAGLQPAEVELVSGLTDVGVPGLAYALATELGIRTVGISARAALRSRSGVFPVHERILVGERYGDESEVFIARIDALIRVGGGPQSRREVELFRKKLEQQGLSAEQRLVERELAWLG